MVGILFVLAVIFVGYMVALASSAPVERHIVIHARSWPKMRPTVRVVLLTDLHVSWPGNSQARLIETVARVNAARPDLILIAGDFVTNASFVRRASVGDATAPLSALRARLGVVAVPGNNDEAVRQPLAARLSELGITVLENRALRRGPLGIIGLDDHATGHLNVAAAMTSYRQTGGWPVFLSHSPYSVWVLPPGGGLVLAGHTHCGQISLPVVGGIMTPRPLRRYDCGTVRDGDRVTIVSAGLGISILPLRLGAPPDYWVVDIGP